MSEYNSRQERRKTKSPKSKGKKKGKKGTFKKVLLSLVVLFLIGIAAGGITAIAYINNAPELDPDSLANPQSSVILDRNDEEVQTLAGSKSREVAKIDEIPDIVKNAFVSVEDTRFYEHFGIDPRRIGGAVLANFKEGFGAEGASTITQQVIKNSLLTSEKSLERKVQEAYLSIKLEQQYTKDQILEMYLNKIYFGNGAWGVVDAAETYFDKNIVEDELTPGEAALLAGLPQRPTAYDPFDHPEVAEERRNTVLSLMKKQGVITAEEQEKYSAIKVSDMVVESNKDETGEQYKVFIDRVVKELQERKDISEKDIYSGGLTIHTTLDTNAQEITNDVISNYNYTNDYMRSGLVLLDTKTGSVRAIGETRKDESVIPYATTDNLQTGSTAKPIISYGPAIENMQWSTGRSIKDEKLEINGHPIRNWDRKYRGQVSMRKALEWSYNVPAVNTFTEVGEGPAQEFANKLGLGLEDENMVPTAAIGSFGSSPLEMAGAYAAFGNNGNYNKPHTVRKVVFPDGREINLEPESVTAMKDYTAYMITDMLKTVVTSGTGTDAKISGLPVAGKTGTTNHPQDVVESKGFPTSGITRDAWFAGYTTEYSMAVWTGFNSPNSHYLDSSKGEDDTSKILFREIMRRVSEGINTADFKKPDSVVEVGVEKETGLLPSDYTPKDQIVYELFVKGHTPEKTSNKYQQPEGVKDLSAQYDEASNSISVSWKPGGQKDYTYKVEMSVDGGEYATISESSNTAVSVDNVSPGSEFTFKVTAIVSDTGVTSKSAQTSVTVPKEEEPEPEEEENEETDQDGQGEGNDNQGDGNNEGNGDGQGNSNGGNDGTSDDSGNDGSSNDGSGNGQGNGNQGDGGNGNGSGNTGGQGNGQGNGSDGTKPEEDNEGSTTDLIPQNN
ncbi:PBP1A family penicillin-binding protein [Guptibacillus algicola]|uniref:PBP1A family penicillin-binding protein n=1 Tax=Guptibacillus algicola TaxID=225844 RepID=UPI001CD584A7|nr:PBP1A family penicillin-binding protein [Alkalihalobacillus algicola]MCA0985741.1 PBP1A family penicillin-binding protein [Alkalihalobacillus algicola]